MVFRYRRRAAVRLACLVGTALLLLFLAAGCGAGEEDPAAAETANGEEEVEQEEEVAEEEGEEGLEEVLAGWENPRSFHALTDSFKELKYQFTGDGVSETIHYTLEGTETVGGTEAEKISLRFLEEGSEYSWWVDGEGNVLRLDMDGEIMEGELAAMAGESLMAMAFMPYYYVDDFEARDVLAGSYPGYSVQLVDQKTEQFGASQAQVYTLEVTVGPPLSEQEGTVRWSVGDFGDFSMLVGWEAVDALEGLAFGYRLLEVNPVN